jgi:hypothetical protein
VEKNIVQLGRPQMTVWCKCIRCWIPKATNTHSEYVILIAFPQELWWHKHASMLSYMYCTLSVLLKSEKDALKGLMKIGQWVQKLSEVSCVVRNV